MNHLSYNFTFLLKTLVNIIKSFSFFYVWHKQIIINRIWRKVDLLWFQFVVLSAGCIHAFYLSTLLVDIRQTEFDLAGIICPK